MCKSSFYCKFKEVFGMTAKQWLLKQRNTHILNKVMTSETTVGELMEEFRFESQAAFTHIGEGDEIIYIAYFKIISNDKIFES